MPLRPIVRRIVLACSTVFLIALAWGALSGGLRQLPRIRTVSQRIETAVQLSCGLLSLLIVVMCFRWRRWNSAVRSGWAISVATAAGLSSFVWGPPMPLIALLFAVGTLLVALAVIWALRTALSADQGAI
jgi:hypothetical protein